MAKKITIILIVIVLIISSLLLALIIPGQRQIRAVNIQIPKLTDIQEKLASVADESKPVRIEFINTSTQNTPYGVLGHIGVLISWADGKQFLIDTGMNKEEARKFSSNLELLGAEPSENFGAIEEQMGEQVNNISGIALTHLHTDHSFGVSGVCSAIKNLGASATIFQTQNQSSVHNTFTEPGQVFVNASVCEKELLGDELIKTISGFDALFAIDAGGHTPGSTLFVTQVNNEIWVFAGDLTNQMADIHNNKDKGFMYSYILVPENTKLLESWRLWLNEADQQDNVKVLVAHDINAFENSGLPYWKAPE